MSSRLKLAGIVLLASFGLAACGGGGGGTATTSSQTSMTVPDPAVAEREAIEMAITAAMEAVAKVTDTADDAAVTAAEDAIADAEDAIEDAANVPPAETAANSLTVAGIETDLADAKASRQEAMDAIEIAELQKQINDLRTQLGLEPDGNLSDSISELQRQARELAQRIEKEEEDAAEKLQMEANARGKDMFAALAGATTNALDNIAAPVLAPTGLTINANAGAGSFATGTDPDDADGVVLKAGDSAGMLGDWAGTDYALTSGTGDSKVTNAARVYNNRGAGTRRDFDDVHEVHTAATAGDDIKGYHTVDETNDLAMIMAPAFLHSGTQDHAYDSDNDVAFYTRGTFDGAPGRYRCTGDCSSTNDGSGSPSELTGVWHFMPDANAMVHQPDANYLYYGWWVSKDNEDAPTAASAFAGTVGTIAALPVNPDTLTGSATYAGNAAGKFAFNNAAEGTGDGGHFTADVALNAKFGATTAPNNGGVSGTIDNFRLNDGSEDPGWSVELKRAGWDSGADTFGATTAGTTVWSINGNKEAESGAWRGTVYDEMPGNTDGTPPGDGSNIPTTVTGTFYSEFGTQGRMVGGFGADKQ